MKPTINTKELCKLIKFSGKHGSVIWSREENQHFVSNRYFMVRFEILPNDVLAALFGVFYQIPDIGVTFNAYNGEMNTKAEPIKYDKIYLPREQDTVGTATDYLRDIGTKHMARVMKFPAHYTFLDTQFLKLVEGELIPKTKGNSPHQPVYFANGDLLILPYRVENEKFSIEINRS